MNNCLLNLSDYMMEDGGYFIADNLWKHFQSSTIDGLYFKSDGGDVMISVRAGQEKGFFSWNYSKTISDSGYSTASGKTETIEKACSAALAYTPDILEFEYLGKTHLWYGSKHTNHESENMIWVANIGGDYAEVRGPIFYNYSGNEERYFVERKWLPAEAILKLM